MYVAFNFLPNIVLYTEYISYNLLILYAKNGVLFISLTEIITKIDCHCK